MTIEEYIEEQEEVLKPRLRQVYKTIREELPDAEERISWGMPTFRKGINLIHFAAAKKHIGLYPGSEAILAFESELNAYKTSKGAIQFPHDRELPLELIRRIARWCYERNAK